MVRPCVARELSPSWRMCAENIHVGDKVPKGYVFKHFEEAFTRYLAPEGVSKPLNRSNADEMGTSEPFQTAPTEPEGAVRKCEKSANDGHKSGRAVANGGNGHASVRNDLEGCSLAPDSPPDPEW